MSISSVSSSNANAAHARAMANKANAEAKAAKDAEDSKDVQKSAEAEGQADDGDGVSNLTAVHSVVAGALGLDDPTVEKPPEEKHNGFYNAGKWMAAAGTIGTIISVLA